jgi:hypothetical protein
MFQTSDLAGGNVRVLRNPQISKAESGATMKTELLRFNGAVERDPAIDAWMKAHAGGLGAIAHQWFEVNAKMWGRSPGAFA